MRSLRNKLWQIAELCGVPGNTGVHAVRGLGDFWPQPGRGHRDIPLDTRAAVALAVALSGPPGESGSYVRNVGGLRRSTPDEEFTSFEDSNERQEQMRAAGESGDLVIEDVIFRPSLLDTLVTHTDRLRGAEHDALGPQASNMTVEITRATGGADVIGYWARVRFVTATGRRVGFFYTVRDRKPANPDLRETAIRNTQTLPGGLFLALANTLRADDARRSEKPPGTGNPEPSAATADDSGLTNGQTKAGSNSAPFRMMLGTSNTREHTMLIRTRAMPLLQFGRLNIGDDLNGRSDTAHAG